MAAEDDLGALMPPSEGEAPKSTWTSLVQDPNTRAAMDAAARNMMITAGLQMMVPQWGGPMANIAHGLGKGFESMGKTAESAMSAEEQNRQLAEKVQSGKEHNQTTLEAARIAANSRQEVAQIRSEAMLERARLIRQPQTSQEMKIAADAQRDYLKTEKNNQLVSKKTDQQINEEARAWGLIAVQNARDATGVRSQGAPLPTEPGAENPAGEGRPGTITPPGNPAAAAKSASIPFDQFLAKPGVAEAMKDPEFQKKLLAEHPEYTRDVT